MGLLNLDAINTINENINTKDLVQKKVHFSQLKDHPANNQIYTLSEIDELADDILYNGNNSPILASPLEDGNYQVICGHRRKAATQLLIERGHSEFNELNILITPVKDEILLGFKLVGDNLNQRHKKDITFIKEVKYLRHLCEKAEERGMVLNQPIIEIIKDKSNMSLSRVKRYDLIGRRLIPELLEEIEKENLSISTAYEISLLPESQQIKLKRIYDGGKIILLDEINSLKTTLYSDVTGENSDQIINDFINVKLDNKEQKKSFFPKYNNISDDKLESNKTFKKATTFNKRFNIMLKELKIINKTKSSIDKETYEYLREVIDNFHELEKLVDFLKVE